MKLEFGAVFFIRGFGAVSFVFEVVYFEVCPFILGCVFGVWGYEIGF